MSFRWRSFERQTRRHVRSAVRASGSLSRQWRAVRSKKWRSLQGPPWLGRLFWMALVPMILLAMNPPVEHMEALIGLWLLGETISHVGRLNTVLYDPASLCVYSLLPLPDRTVFGMQFRKHLQDSLWLLLETVIIVLLIKPTGIAWLVCMALAVPITVFMVAGALVLRAYAPLKYSAYIGLALKGFALAGVFIPAAEGLFPLLRNLTAGFPGAQLLINAARGAYSASPAGMVFGLVLGCAAICAAPLAYRKLRADYSLGEDLFTFAHLMCAAQTGHAITPAEWTEPYRLDSNDARARVLSGEFLKPMNWSDRGWMERFISMLLTQRERTITEYLVAAIPQWSSGFRKVTFVIIGATAVAFLFPGIMDGQFWLAVLCFALFISAIGGGWSGLGLPAAPGMQSPCYATQPLSFWAMAQTMLKVNVIRYAVLIPLVIGVWLVLPSLRALGPMLLGKLLLLGLLLQPCGIPIPISSSTNDTNRIKVVLSLAPVFLLILASVLACVATKGVLCWIAGTCTGLLSIALLAIYGAFYTRNSFDLIPIRKDS